MLLPWSILLASFFIGVFTSNTDINTNSINPKCLDPPYDDCSFYTECIESQFHCGPGGYPVGYGFKYCSVFSEKRHLFSEEGVKWMLDTMHCLQRTLVPFIHSEDSESSLGSGDPNIQLESSMDDSDVCLKLGEVAFESHSGCYLKNGVCDLPWKDLLSVSRIVGYRALLLGGWDALREVWQVGQGCLALRKGKGDVGMGGEL